ncbi:uncharacterized protein LOC129738423 [Uranotaenia lowii]|uniref:uncharacterized protein LOC129738423 n=1 Tax=Uranotaenia lowii TaxID=190385 RepID=UPI0024784680|nr:uncharacterized protein LOC129738423 [Uranotaenia lowii]
MEQSNLEENFKFSYRVARQFIFDLADEDKVTATQWLRKLASTTDNPGLRNHYLNLLLVSLQQGTLVGPFKQSPPEDGAGKLVPFEKDYQPKDIQQLIVQEREKIPPPPVTEQSLSGDRHSTEYAAAQEIPNFGSQFGYVCSAEPLSEFQRSNQSKLTDALQGPSKVTLQSLNESIDQFIREELQKRETNVRIESSREPCFEDSQLRFSPDPMAPATPNVFKPGRSKQGLHYELKEFGLPPNTKFGYPCSKFSKITWTPSNRAGRPQVRDIVKDHPFPSTNSSIPRSEHELSEQQRRARLIQGADTRTRDLLNRYYAQEVVKPRRLEYSDVEEAEEGFEPLLLDETPPDEIINLDSFDQNRLFGDSEMASPEIRRVLRTSRGHPSARRYSPQKHSTVEETFGSSRANLSKVSNLELVDDPSSPFDFYREAQNRYREIMREITPPPISRTPQTSRQYQQPRVTPLQSSRVVETPDQMAAIIGRIQHQISTNNELSQIIAKSPQSAPTEQLKCELKNSNRALDKIRNQLQRIRESNRGGAKSNETLDRFNQFKRQLQNLSALVDVTQNSIHKLSNTIENVPEPTLQNAVLESASIGENLHHISRQIRFLMDTFDSSTADTSLGLIDETGLSGGGFDESNAIVQALEKLNASMMDVFKSPKSNKITNAVEALHNLQSLVDRMSIGASTLDTSMPYESLADTFLELEESIRSEIAAVQALSKATRVQELVQKSQGTVIELSDLLKSVQDLKRKPSRQSEINARLKQLKAGQLRTPPPMPATPPSKTPPTAPSYKPFMLESEESEDSSKDFQILREEEMSHGFLEDVASPSRWARSQPMRQEHLDDSAMITDDLFEEGVASPRRVDQSMRQEHLDESAMFTDDLFEGGIASPSRTQGPPRYYRAGFESSHEKSDTRVSFQCLPEQSSSNRERSTPNVSRAEVLGRSLESSISPHAKVGYLRPKSEKTGTPPNRAARPQDRNVIEDYPLSSMHSSVRRPEHELYQRQKRAQLIRGGDTPIRNLPNRYYAQEVVKPRRLQYSDVEDTEKAFEPLLLDETPADDIINLDSFNQSQLFEDSKMTSPEIRRYLRSPKSTRQKRSPVEKSLLTTHDNLSKISEIDFVDESSIPLDCLREAQHRRSKLMRDITPSPIDRTPSRITPLLDPHRVDTPDQMTNIIGRIQQQINTNNELAQLIARSPQTAQSDQLKCELNISNRALDSIRTRLQRIRESNLRGPERNESLNNSTNQFKQQLQNLSALVDVTQNSLHNLSNTMENVPEPAVQNAVLESASIGKNLHHISRQIRFLMDTFDSSMADSSLGLINESALSRGDGLDDSNAIVQALEKLNASILDVFGGPKPNKITNAANALQNLQSLVDRMSFGASTLDTSMPYESLADTFLELEQSIQSEIAAVQALSNGSCIQELVQKSRDTVEKLNELLMVVQDLEENVGNQSVQPTRKTEITTRLKHLKASQLRTPRDIPVTPSLKTPPSSPHHKPITLELDESSRDYQILREEEMSHGFLEDVESPRWARSQRQPMRQEHLDESAMFTDDLFHEGVASPRKADQSMRQEHLDESAMFTDDLFQEGVASPRRAGGNRINEDFSQLINSVRQQQASPGLGNTNEQILQRLESLQEKVNHVLNTERFLSGSSRGDPAQHHSRRR